MRNQKLILYFVFLSAFNLTGLQAQEAVTAGGGEASGSGGSVSYSVGQVVYTIHTGTSGSVSQGVQHPYEIYVETGIDHAKGINLICTSYPNPVTDALILEIRDFSNQQLMYRLYDLNGRLLESKEIAGNITPISMVDLASGSYFLKVLQVRLALPQQEQNPFLYEIQTFKIIKH